jgi:hypothetical protein
MERLVQGQPSTMWVSDSKGFVLLLIVCLTFSAMGALCGPGFGGIKLDYPLEFFGFMVLKTLKVTDATYR